MKSVLVCSGLLVLLAPSTAGQSADIKGMIIEEITPGRQEQQGEGLEFQRQAAAWSLLDWTGPAAGEVISRIEPMTIGEQGELKSGGLKWTVADSVGTWLTKNVAFLATGGVLIAILGAVGSVLGGSGGISKLISGLGQFLTFPIPIVGAVVQRVLAGIQKTSFQQVVAGGDRFKAALAEDATLAQDVRDRIWDLFKTSQQQAQDVRTQDAVQEARK